MYIPNAKKTILIVEDDCESNDNIAHILESKFAEVFSAYDGLEGWKKYCDYSPDVILTDIEMPKMNGLELVRRIRAENSTVPIVILSSYSHHHYLFEAIPLKLEDYLIKPITMKKLDTLLQTLESRGGKNKLRIVDINATTQYDFKIKSIIQNNSILRLSHLEILLIELLLKRRNMVISYEEIESCLYDTKEVSRNALKIIVSNLRKKVPALTIQAIPKLGYRLS